MIQLFADGELVYDSRTSEVPLMGLEATLGLNKGGTATITMPPQHPAYNSFVSYKTIVEIYRDEVRRFRGRALYPTDDFKLCRAVTCEGEKCFFRDAVHRPYGYRATPKVVFTTIINLYNQEVEEAKRFEVGEVTVTNLDQEIQIESEEAEAFSTTIDNLINTYGGYLVFTDTPEGKRAVNWYSEIDYRSHQTIELGKNLMDFKRTTANSDLATVIIPYGAVDENTGKRFDIKTVNNGIDYIEDAEAIKLRGRIAKPIVFSDVHNPTWLLQKAKEYLATSKNLVSSLELSAIDLSLVDKDIDSFTVGDNIEVITKPHGIYNEMYLLTEQTIDFLHPQNDKISLGKSAMSLTGADAAGDKNAQSSIKQLTQSSKQEYSTNTEAVMEETRRALMTIIQQTAEALMLEVSEEYATNEGLQSAISTTMTQLTDSFNFLFKELEVRVDANDAESREHFIEIFKYIRFENGNIVLGEEGNEIILHIENDRISFLDAGAEVAYFSNKKLIVVDGSFIHSLKIGNFEARVRGNGNLSIIKVGG